jgi:hypothetical protein
MIGALGRIDEMLQQRTSFHRLGAEERDEPRAFHRFQLVVQPTLGRQLRLIQAWRRTLMAEKSAASIASSAESHMVDVTTQSFSLSAIVRRLSANRARSRPR